MKTGKDMDFTRKSDRHCALSVRKPLLVLEAEESLLEVVISPLHLSLRLRKDKRICHDTCIKTPL
jgi:hypothetical protein